MSGPKSSSYTVVNAAELRRRAEARRRAEIAELQARHLRLLAHAGELASALGEDFTLSLEALPSGDPRALRERLSEDEARMEQAAKSARIAGTIRAAAAAGRERREASGPGKDWKQQAQEDIERIIGRLDGDADEQEATLVATSARSVAETESPQAAEIAADALRIRVQTVNESVKARRFKAATLADLRDSLAGMEGPEVAQALELLAAAEDSPEPLSDDLAPAVESAREAALLRADGAFAFAVLEECLEGMGYELGDSFQTLLAKDGQADIRRADWPGYAVRIRAADQGRSLGMNVVRGRSTRVDQRQRDIAREVAFCADHEQLLKDARKRGLELELTHSLAPGERPVQEVEDLGYSQFDAREQQQPCARARTLDP